MNSDNGFFGTLLSICSGTEIFPELTKRKFSTAAGHFLLLVLLVSLLGTIGAFWRLDKEVSPLRENITLSFGERLWVSDRGILPEKLPEAARTLELPGNGRLFYAGEVPKEQGKPLELAGLNYFIYWQAGMPTLAMRNAEDSWLISRPGENRIWHQENNTADALNKILEESDNQLWKNVLPQEIKINKVINFIEFFYCLTFFLWEFILFVFSGFALTGIISLIFSFSRYGNRQWLKWWKVCIYSAFPAVVIAGFFPMLDLPFFKFTDVFWICLVIYWFAAVRRIIRESDAPSSPQNKGGEL